MTSEEADRLADALCAEAAGLVKCDCGHPDCDAMVCPVCSCGDCKWPGACYGKCSWCGERTQPSVVGGSECERSDGLGLHMQAYCSPECGDESWADGERRGLVFKLDEFSLERQAELLSDLGSLVKSDGSKVGPVESN